MMKRYLLAILLPLGLCSIAHAAPHGFYLTQQQRNLNSILRIGTVFDGPQKLVYYGGPVLGNAKVYVVFWGNQVDATTQKQIGGFYSAALNSTYMDWLKEYNTNISAVGGRKGTNQIIARGKYVEAITIQPTHTNTTLDDKDIQAELDHQISVHVLPKPDANTLFMNYFPPGTTITMDNQASCQAFCAYHENFVSKNFGNVFYGVMPDQGGACAYGCGSGSQFDNLTSVSSHELIEAITDPMPAPGNTPVYPQAWNTTDGNEIGDLCVGNETQVTTQGLTYALQQEFDNKTAACAAGPYQSP